jgi:hypothetical protein
MPENNDDKESFFDFDEARSWPPNDVFETEGEGEKDSTETAEAGLDFSKLTLPESKSKEIEKPEKLEEPEEDYTIDDFILPEEYQKALEQRLGTDFDIEEKKELPEKEQMILKPELPEEENEAKQINDEIADLFKPEEFNFKQEVLSKKPKERSTLEDLILEEEQSINQGPALKAYASYDYAEEAGAEEFKADQSDEKKQELQLSRPAIIFIALLLLVGGYWIYKSFFTRTYESTRSRREVKAPLKKSTIKIENELKPLWDITSQKSKNWKEDYNYIKQIKSSSGRENPFLLPESVLEDLRKAAEAELIKKAVPDINNYNAYRATLVGVVESETNILAIIDLRTASFEVLEGTSKPKIIKLAIKEMTKAKSNSLELFQGDNIGGSWIIDSIDTGDTSMSEAKVIIRRGKDYKSLRMGQAVDLGVFDQDDDLVVFSE